MGLANDGVGYALDENNEALITDDMKAAVEDLKAKIIAGEIDRSRLHLGQQLPAVRRAAQIEMTDISQREAQRPPAAAQSGSPGWAIELIGINKSFGPVHANKDIDLAVRKGSVHGIVGENGAGKSTLMSILYGFYTADSGKIKVDGKEVLIADPRHALKLGIGMVHQHFMLVDNFTVLENVVLGVEDSALLGPSLSRARGELARLGRDYEMEVDPDALIEDLSVGQQQRVEILKALYRGAETLILDEPTGVLTPAEADHLVPHPQDVEGRGQDHHSDHPQAPGDHGHHRRGVGHAPGPDGQDAHRRSNTDPGELAELMVGRRVLLRVDKTKANPGDFVLAGARPHGQRRPRRKAGQGRQFRRPGRRNRRHRRRGRQWPVRTARSYFRHA